MEDQLEPFLRIALVLFMAASLFEIGLGVPLRAVRAALGDWRFAGATVLWGYVACPVLAVVLTRVLPLEQPYAAGLILLAMAPGAPFLPAVAARAGGAPAYAAAFFVIATVGAVVYMPLAVPVLVTGFTADPWAIARPIISFIAAPLAVGAALQAAAPATAAWLQPIVRVVAIVATVLLLVLVALIYGREFLGVVGTYAIAAQCLFLTFATAGAYLLSPRFPEGQRRVLALGLCTRNIGAAAAPLLAGGADRRAMVMVALAVPTTIAGAALASRWLSRRDGGRGRP